MSVWIGLPCNIGGIEKTIIAAFKITHTYTNDGNPSQPKNTWLLDPEAPFEIDKLRRVTGAMLEQYTEAGTPKSVVTLITTNNLKVGEARRFAQLELQPTYISNSCPLQPIESGTFEETQGK